MKRIFLKERIFVLCYIAYAGIYAARLNLSMASPVYGFWNKGGNFTPMFIFWVVLYGVSIVLMLLQKKGAV